MERVVVLVVLCGFSILLLGVSAYLIRLMRNVDDFIASMGAMPTEITRRFIRLILVAGVLFTLMILGTAWVALIPTAIGK